MWAFQRVLHACAGFAGVRGPLGRRRLPRSGSGRKISRRRAMTSSSRAPPSRRGRPDPLPAGQACVTRWARRASTSPPGLVRRQEEKRRQGHRRKKKTRKKNKGQDLRAFVLPTYVERRWRQGLQLPLPQAHCSGPRRGAALLRAGPGRQGPLHGDPQGALGRHYPRRMPASCGWRRCLSRGPRGR